MWTLKLATLSTSEGSHRHYRLNRPDYRAAAAGVSIANAAGYALLAAHEMGQSDAQVMGTVT